MLGASGAALPSPMMGAGFSYGQTMMYGCISGWWFGTWLLVFHILGIMIPTDFHIVQRGRYTTNQIWIFMDRWSPKKGMGMGLWSIYDMQVGSRWFKKTDYLDLWETYLQLNGFINQLIAGERHIVSWIFLGKPCWKLPLPVTKDGKTWYRASASVSNEQDEKWSYGFLAACRLSMGILKRKIKVVNPGCHKQPPNLGMVWIPKNGVDLGMVCGIGFEVHMHLPYNTWAQTLYRRWRSKRLDLRKSRICVQHFPRELCVIS